MHVAQIPHGLAARGTFSVLGRNKNAGENEREVLMRPHEQKTTR
jgi:hypothetical protein